MNAIISDIRPVCIPSVSMTRFLPVQAEADTVVYEIFRLPPDVSEKSFYRVGRYLPILHAICMNEKTGRRTFSSTSGQFLNPTITRQTVMAQPVNNKHSFVETDFTREYTLQDVKTLFEKANEPHASYAADQG